MSRLRGAALARRLARLRAFILDVDGVLTDGGLWYGARGEPLRRFDVKDGLGLRLVQEAGVAVAFISGETGNALLRRAAKLRVRDVYSGVEDKRSTLLRFLASRKIIPADAAYMGDDLNDLGPLRAAGLAIAPADAAAEVLRVAHWRTSRTGGRGAVREVCDALLAARLQFSPPSDR